MLHDRQRRRHLAHRARQRVPGMKIDLARRPPGARALQDGAHASHRRAVVRDAVEVQAVNLGLVRRHLVYRLDVPIVPSGGAGDVHRRVDEVVLRGDGGRPRGRVVVAEALLQPRVARHALLVVRVLLVVDERVAHQRRAVEQDAAHRVQRKDLGRARRELARREVDLEARLLRARRVRPRLEGRHRVQRVIDPRVGARALVNVDKGSAEGEGVARRVRLLVAVLDAAPRPVPPQVGLARRRQQQIKRSLRGAAPA